MAKKRQQRGVSNEKIMGLLLDMDERMATKDDLKGFATKDDLNGFATKDDLRAYATKNDLERFKEEILEEIRPIAKAVDKDAVTLVGHEKRITMLERKAALK